MAQTSGSIAVHGVLRGRPVPPHGPSLRPRPRGPRRGPDVVSRPRLDVPSDECTNLVTGHDCSARCPCCARPCSPALATRVRITRAAILVENVAHGGRRRVSQSRSRAVEIFSIVLTGSVTIGCSYEFSVTGRGTPIANALGSTTRDTHRGDSEIKAMSRHTLLTAQHGRQPARPSRSPRRGLAGQDLTSAFKTLLKTEAASEADVASKRAPRRDPKKRDEK